MKRLQTLKRQQRGATLIVVLIMLLIITIVGVMAIRIAMTSLNIATNSQIGQLLMQTGDVPTNLLLNRTTYRDLTSVSSVIGKVISDQNDPLKRGNEYVFCYRPTAALNVSSVLDMTVLIPPLATDPDNTKAAVDSSETNRSGFCDLESDFGSSREAVVTQVAIKFINETEVGAARGKYLDRGTDASADAKSQQGKVDGRVRITATSILPNYSSADLATVQQECIGNGSGVGYINDNTDTGLRTKKTMADCLSDYGIPVNTQIQEIDLKTRFIQITAPT